MLCCTLVLLPVDILSSATLAARATAAAAVDIMAAATSAATATAYAATDILQHEVHYYSIFVAIITFTGTLYVRPYFFFTILIDSKWRFSYEFLLHS